MNKNNSNAKDMKAVTLSFEKFGFLRNVSAEEAGEFLQVILDYAMTGNVPEFKDKYQKMYYQTYLDVITEQMIAATKRANNLRKNAKERADAVKEAKKIIAKQGREAKGVIPSGASVDAVHVTTSQTMSDNRRDVTSRSLFDNEEEKWSWLPSEALSNRKGDDIIGVYTRVPRECISFFKPRFRKSRRFQDKETATKFSDEYRRDKVMEGET